MALILLVMRVRNILGKLISIYFSFTVGELNDLWKFDGKYWTWISGSNDTDQDGNYGQKGVAAATNIPGARVGAVSWIDIINNLWLFGGWL